MSTKDIKLLEAIHKKNEGKQVLIFTDKEFEALFNDLKMLLIQKEKQKEYDDIMVCDESDIL